MTTTRLIGKVGENMAARTLERAGMHVLERNWRCAAGDVRGELDIVARDGDVLVFVEVKARRGEGAGGPLEAITPEKVGRLRRLAAAWLALHDGEGGDVRFDAVGVCWPSNGGRASVEHVRGIS